MENPPPIPVTVEEVHQGCERSLLDLRESPVAVSELQASLVKCWQSILERLCQAETYRSLLEAQNRTLAVYHQGVQAGAFSGVLLLGHGVTPDLSLPETHPQPDLLSLLFGNLNNICTVADGPWRSTHLDDLYLLCEYGKHQNLGTLEEGNALLDLAPEDGLKFLAATFKSGFAVGIAQAAVTLRD